MGRVVDNNFSTTLDGAINNTDTNITLTSVAGLPLPLGVGEYIRFTLSDSSGNYEIFETNNINSGTRVCSSCVRGVEGTTAQSWADGDDVEIRATAELMLTADNLMTLFNSGDIVWPTDTSPDNADNFICYNNGGLFHNDVISLMSGTAVGSLFKSYSGTVETAAWVNDTDATLATDELLPTNEMVRDYVAASGGGGSGDFVGPASSADNEVVLFDSTTGKLGKRPGTSGMIIPSGTDAQRGSTNYQLRWNTDRSHMEIRNGSWTDQQILMEADFSSNGVLVKTGSLTYAGRTITGTTNYIDVTNGNGSGGNPTITVSSNYPGGSSIATLGAVTQGTWNATTIGVAYGDTGVTSVTTTPTASKFAGWDTNINLSSNNFLSGYTSTATAAGNTTLTVASSRIQVFTGVTTQTVTMPDVTSSTLGHTFEVTNQSTGTVTVTSSGGNTIRALATNTRAMFMCVAITGTTAAFWSFVYLPIDTAMTGTGSLVRGTGPTLSTPTLGVASATSINFGQDALNYYDEGTFTPTFTTQTVGDLSVTYAIQSGIYTRIGRMVFFRIAITFTPTFTTAAGQLRVDGLPFSVTSTHAGVMQSHGSTITYPAGVSFIFPNVQNGTTYFVLQGLGSGTSITTLSTTTITSGVQQVWLVNGYYTA